MWVYRYKRHGKEAKLSLGHYPVVALAAAQEGACRSSGRSQGKARVQALPLIMRRAVSEDDF
ncbi:hypothetical protein GmRootV59_52640 (plasmid) [Variovorax sp. V59]|uniref:Arm DNA-binding domain-containing protein n=1 Tax=unclassified Variovorax TaxID=663243 RepID=UPI0034E893F2